MAGYVKLFQTILDSSIWMEDDQTRLVWITMLAKANREGVVEASVPGLAHAARVSVEDCRRALVKFQEPDLESRSKEHEGRRIQETNGGWLILNHDKYKEMLSLEERREYWRRKQAEARAKKNAASVGVAASEIVKERVAARTEAEKRMNGE